MESSGVVLLDDGSVRGCWSACASYSCSLTTAQVPPESMPDSGSCAGVVKNAGGGGRAAEAGAVAGADGCSPAGGCARRAAATGLVAADAMDSATEATESTRSSSDGRGVARADDDAKADAPCAREAVAVLGCAAAADAAAAAKCSGPPAAPLASGCSKSVGPCLNGNEKFLSEDMKGQMLELGRQHCHVPGLFTLLDQKLCCDALQIKSPDSQSKKRQTNQNQYKTIKTI